MSLIENLNKIFDSRIRLGIMSALMVNKDVNFNELKELLNKTFLHFYKLTFFQCF